VRAREARRERREIARERDARRYHDHRHEVIIVP
jgi:hypothetical protein